jgi:hypothetical protein
MSTQPLPIQGQQPASPKWLVQAPDSKVIQFPDEFTDADVTREMSKMYPTPTTANNPVENAAPKPYYGFGASNLAGQAWQGVKDVAGGAYQMGKDVLFPQGNTEGQRLSFLAHKYVTDPLKQQQQEAQASPTTSERLGHTAASYLPFIGPMAANLGQQAGSGDVGGMFARGAGQVGTAMAGSAALQGAGDAVGAGRAALGKASYTPEGVLKPLPKVVSKAGGAAIGSAVHPGAGLLGYVLGPEAYKAIFPNPIADDLAQAKFMNQGYRPAEPSILSRTTPPLLGTGEDAAPLRPTVGTPEEWAAYDQRMGNLKAEASDAGTYSAARGKAGKKLNYQQRIGKTY